MSLEKIIIKGAKVNNLKNISLELPRDKLIVFTGVSGSGKSSLAFDTIYAEGQRRYVESLSSYARQFLGQMNKPDVEYIEGLSPSISIDQKATNRNPRSTVGTVTEIYDYMRLLYSKIGIPYCPVCGKEISAFSIDQMIEKILSLPERSRIMVLAPVIRGKKGEFKKLLENLKKEGFNRVILDGEQHELGEPIAIEKNKKHNIDVVVDRLITKPEIRSRLSDTLDTALNLGNGLVRIDVQGGEVITLSSKLSCPDEHITLEEISPRMFSFNSPFGMCPECDGLGYHKQIDPQLIIPDMNLSILEGAISPYATSKEGTYYHELIKALCEEDGFSLDQPLSEAPDELIHKLLYGTGQENVTFIFDSHFSGRKRYSAPFEGVIENLNRRYLQTISDGMKNKIEEYMVEEVCQKCHGNRLKDEVLSIKIGGLNIIELTDFSIGNLSEWFSNVALKNNEELIARPILKEIKERLAFLNNVGLEYLTLSRSAGTLSGGESQRIRLATQIGSSLVGVVYVLDEPSIGLHQRDNEKLLNSLRQLTDLGNTLIVVEHDEETMHVADYIVDIGPGAGNYGGEVVAQGSYDDIVACKESITGQYLSKEKVIPIPKRRKSEKFIEVCGAEEHNLKDIDVKFPMGLFTCVTGVSGSGKSSLVNEILYKALSRDLNRSKQKPGKFKEIKGIEDLDKVIDIDQSPIGRTPRSNPATYTKVFDLIRDLFAMTPDAKMRGYTKGRFSFNIKGGRCESCAGDGTIKVEMHFLPDIYVPCEVCKGKKYNQETLNVKYKGKSIFDVLEMTVDEALVFFENLPNIRNKIQTLSDVGLGYIRLGQSSTELSGGEAQRVKLAAELSKRSTGKTVYILDEPTTGLHTADIHKLVNVLNKFVDMGNTVIVIEHNLDVIKNADHIIDLGPEGGDKGGTIVCTGTPEEVAAVKNSYTGNFLKRIL